MAAATGPRHRFRPRPDSAGNRPFGRINPRLELLPNGILALVAGRPDNHVALSYDGTGTAGQCGRLIDDVLCRTGRAVDASYAAILGGSVSIPKAVRAATSLGRPELRIGVQTLKADGSAKLAYGVGAAGATRSMGKGTTTGPWTRWSGNPATATVAVAVGDDTVLTVHRFTVAFRYRALV